MTLLLMKAFTILIWSFSSGSVTGQHLVLRRLPWGTKAQALIHWSEYISHQVEYLPSHSGASGIHMGLTLTVSVVALATGAVPLISPLIFTFSICHCFFAYEDKWYSKVLRKHNLFSRYFLHKFLHDTHLYLYTWIISSLWLYTLNYVFLCDHLFFTITYNCWGVLVHSDNIS